MARPPQTLRTTHVASITGTTGEHWPHLVDVTGNPLLQDTGVWGVAGVDLGANCLRGGRTYFFFGDTVTKNFPEPFAGPDFVAWTDDESVWRHGGHQALGFNFILPYEPPALEGESGWRFCTECHALFWSLAPVNRCSGSKDGWHNAAGLLFRLPVEPTDISGQYGWRRCAQCAELVYFGQSALTVPGCPVDGTHRWNAADPAYVLPSLDGGEGVPPEGQPAWRFCVRCAAMFWNGEAHKGICSGAPGGGIRLNPVLAREGACYDPFQSSDPVGATLIDETPNAAFAWENRVYVCAGFSRERPGAPAAGQYVCSKVHPEIPGEYQTEFMLSPRHGCCQTDAPPGEPSPSRLSHNVRGFTFMMARAATNSSVLERGWWICGQVRLVILQRAWPAERQLPG
jgi:hypothetical protein